MPRNECRFPECTIPVPEGHARCELHAFRWTAGKPVEPEPMSPWVRRIREGKGVAKVFAA